MVSDGQKPTINSTPESGDPQSCIWVLKGPEIGAYDPDNWYPPNWKQVPKLC